MKNKRFFILSIIILTISLAINVYGGDLKILSPWKKSGTTISTAVSGDSADMQGGNISDAGNVEADSISSDDGTINMLDDTTIDPNALLTGTELNLGKNIRTLNSYASISAAITDTANWKELWATEAYTCPNSAITISSGDTLKILQGAILTPQSNTTLTFASGSSFSTDGIYQCFGNPNLDWVTFNSGVIDVIYAEWFDDTIKAKAINNALTAGRTAYIPVQLFTKTYAVGDETITIYNYDKLWGQGRLQTILQMDANSNKDCIATYDFTSLTGTNKWLASAGVVHSFEIKGLSIDGNKDNQSSGNGISIYGKHYTVSDVHVYDADDAGFYSEAGTSAAADGDIPTESIIGPMWFRNSDSYNFHFRGPHDALITELLSATCGADGVRIETSATYSASCDIGEIHSYRATDRGIFLDAKVNADLLIGESADKEGVYFDGGSQLSNIGMIEAYLNDYQNSETYYQVYIDASQVKINGIVLRNMDKLPAGGVYINAANCSIGSIVANGNTSGVGKGIVSNANGTIISGANIIYYDTNNAIGLETSSGAGKQYNIINASILNCKTLWNNANTGWNNIYNLSLYTDVSGQDVFSGNSPPLANSEIWNVIGRDPNNVIYRSKNAGTATIPDDSTSVTVSHGLIVTPIAGDIHITPTESLNDASIFWVDTITSSQFNINVDTDPNTDVTFAWRAEL